MNNKPKHTYSVSYFATIENPKNITDELEKLVYGMTLARFISGSSGMGFFESYSYLYDELSLDGNSECELLDVAELYEDCPWPVIFRIVREDALSMINTIKAVFEYAKAAMVKDAERGVFDAFDMNQLDLMHYANKGIKQP